MQRGCAGAQEAVATNLTRELDAVHRDCRALQRTWLSKQGELVAAQVRPCCAEPQGAQGGPKGGTQGGNPVLLAGQVYTGQPLTCSWQAGHVLAASGRMHVDCCPSSSCGHA